jgi:hypothetical protein
VFQGGHEQAPSAAMTAQDAARTEHATIGELPEPDLHEIANRMEPELFARMQTLEGQRDTFKRWLDEGGASEAASKHLATVEAQIAELQPQVAAAYRRAADTTGTGIVEPEQFPSFAAMLAAHESGRGMFHMREHRKPKHRQRHPAEDRAFRLAVKHSLSSKDIQQLRMLAFLALNEPLANSGPLLRTTSPKS